MPRPSMADVVPGTLRVVFYNVRGLRGGASRRDRVVDSDGASPRDRDARVAGVVAALAPDVLAVAEPARGITGRARMREVAASAGLVPVVGGGAARTTALFARADLPVHGARSVRLPWRPGRTRRGFATAVVGGVQVLVAHLGLRSAERLQHVARVLADVDPDRPVLLAGDLNEQPGGGVWQAVTAGLVDLTAEAGPTYPADVPRVRIDAVFGARVRAVGAAHVPGDPDAQVASDHRPVVVDVTAAGDVTAAAGEPPGG